MYSAERDYAQSEADPESGMVIYRFICYIMRLIHQKTYKMYKAHKVTGFSRLVVLSIVYLLCLQNQAYGQDAAPLIRVGIIADIQYGDLDAKGTRFYRNSLGKLESCIADLNRREVHFTLNLGDLTDRNPADLQPVLDRLKALDRKVYNITGNHDYVDVSNNKALYRQLDMPREYYAFKQGKWLFVMLNTNEVASYANIAGTSNEKELAKMLERIREDARSNDKDWNGGISARQMKWLKKLLGKAEKKQENVLIFSHHPLYPAKEFTALNDKEILQALSAFSCVKGVISGHHHVGAFDTWQQIPCITTEGMIETEDTNAYAVLDIYEDRVVLTGIGRSRSYEIMLK